MGRLVAILGVALSVAVARAQADHLKCYKVKDSRPKASYTADLQGLTPEPGCTIRVPGKLLCVETTKTNVKPTPPEGGGVGSPTGRFVCYTVKCPKTTPPTIPWLDQFGAGTLTASAPKLLCAPEVSTTTMSSTTTTTFPTCPVLGNSCGHCGTGLCGHDVDGRLICCATFFDTPCISDASCPPGQACAATAVPNTCCPACP